MYRPRQDLRDHIAALHTKCQFPSCRQPVWRCDIDHREPFRSPRSAQWRCDHNGNTAAISPTAPSFQTSHGMAGSTGPSAYTLSWVSPTGHCYSTTKDQVVAPELWVTTAGGLAAQQLDTIVATQEVNPEVRDGQVSVEEALATLLLRHHLNQRPIEYEPDTDVGVSTDGTTTWAAVRCRSRTRSTAGPTQLCHRFKLHRCDGVRRHSAGADGHGSRSRNIGSVNDANPCGGRHSECVSTASRDSPEQQGLGARPAGRKGAGTGRYDRAVADYASDPEPALREQVARAVRSREWV